jgi:colanic acid/amylovoran biosynthesis glycosyltransferase
MLFSTVKHILKFNRKQLQKQNFKRAVDTINPDIIHAQWVSNIPVLESILAQNKYPVVLSQRGYHINVRPFIDSDNFNYLKEWLPKLAGFHSVSKAISKKGNLIYKNPSKIDPVVYSGLDLEEIPFRKKRRGGKPLELISVGRPHWIKGYSYALKSCAILKDKGIDFKYSIVGAGQNEELLYLRALYNLGDQVVLLDSLPQQAVFEAISQADIMLLTSIEEGVANVAIEAMALGTLVISTDCGGMPELIDDHITGFIVPSRSADVMANKIIEIDKTDHTLLEAIAVKAREKVMTQHSTNKMIADMERLYRNVLNK